jgi:hypothetical protein
LSLVFIFAAIAVIMVASVILIKYYSGNPVKDPETGIAIDNQKRRHLILKCTHELFKDIDYDLIVIFIGIFNV